MTNEELEYIQIYHPILVPTDEFNLMLYDNESQEILSEIINYTVVKYMYGYRINVPDVDVERKNIDGCTKYIMRKVNGEFVSIKQEALKIKDSDKKLLNIIGNIL